VKPADGRSRRVRRLRGWTGWRHLRPSGTRLTAEQWRFDLLAGTMFSLLLALVLSWGPPPVGWRLGDEPDRDIDARVSYQVPDPAAQGALERKARDATPNVYRRDDGELAALSSDLAGLLRAVKGAETRAALPAGVLRSGTLSEAQFAALKAGLLAEERDGQLAAHVSDLVDLAANIGLIAQDRYRAEVEDRHEQILVCGAPAQEAATGGLGHSLGDLTMYRRDEVLVADDAPAVQAALEREAAILSPSACFGPEVRQAVAQFLAERARPNLAHDAAASAAARQASAARVGRVVRLVEAGQVIARRGEPITPALMTELRREQEAYLMSQSPWSPLRRVLARGGIAGLLVGLTGGALWRFQPRLLRSKPRLMVFGILTVLATLAARALALSGWPIYLAPVALFAIGMAIAYDQQLGLLASFVLALFAALATTGDLDTAVVFLVGAAVGVLGAREVRNRARLILVGGAVGLAMGAAVLAAGLGHHLPLAPIFREALWGLAGGVMTGFVVTGGLPFLERAFKITTDISLLELSDANQPLLRELALRAPGTYNHALVVGSLAEAAAEAVGANPLRARLGGLFHDVGKILKPEYFAENRVGAASRHEGLQPPMSALVLITHVRDGLALAREHRLPVVIRDIIVEHHGTTLLTYFYHEAQRRADPEAPEPEEHRYRYPGPTPRSRESAIVMLADAVESASRSMRDPSPARIENLVREIARRRLTDGQFDDCALTLKELAVIQATLAVALARVYHARVRYPDQAELEGAPGEPAGMESTAEDAENAARAKRAR
jgi:putative nucleotidyltransferase with HDIG domain